MEPRQRRILVASLVSAEVARQGTSREWLAESTGVPLAQLNSKLAGESSFDIDELDAIAAALDVAVDAFLEDQ